MVHPEPLDGELALASHWVAVFGLSVIFVAVIGGWLLLWHYFGELGVGSHSDVIIRIASIFVGILFVGVPWLVPTEGGNLAREMPYVVLVSWGVGFIIYGSFRNLIERSLNK